MTVRIMIGDALSQLAELPDESVHFVMTSPPYWGLRAYKGDPGMIGMEPTFDAHLENLVAVFREVRRVLRSDGTLWLNYSGCYAGGNNKMKWAASGTPVRGSERRDAVPNQSHRNARVRSNDKTNTGLLGCPALDCVCCGLCDECQAALRVRTPHNDCTPPPPQQSSSASANAARDMDCSGQQVTETSQPAPPASSTPQSSRLLPGASMPEQSPEASALPSAEPSSLPGVPASACKGCGRGIPGRARTLPLSDCRNRGMGLSSGAYSSYSTAPHKPKDLIDMPGYLAEALRADGWYLRSEIIWHKPIRCRKVVGTGPHQRMKSCSC